MRTSLAYDNARLLAGLDRHGRVHGPTKLRSQRAEVPALAHGDADGASGVFRPVGSQSFGEQRQQPRAFDQQPLEATATIAACLAAWRADGDPMWRAHAVRAFDWFLGGNDLSISLIDLETGSCCDGLHPGRANENRGGESVVSYLLGLAQIRALDRHAAHPRDIEHSAGIVGNNVPGDSATTRGTLTQNTFFNRQAFHLRPDPARVVVRPFKPATEPRDFNSTDRTRANHIVDRVLALDAPTVASQLADVLENFRGRHRNLLEIFEARADEMGVVFAAHPSFTQDQRRLVGAYFLHEYSFEAAALFNPSIVTPPGSVGCAGRRPPIHPEPARGRRGACVLTDFPVRCR